MDTEELLSTACNKCRDTKEDHKARDFVVHLRLYYDIPETINIIY